jgi:hypothetical protein
MRRRKTLQFPKNKGFDLAGGIVITVFLDEFVHLTGTFLGDVHDQHHLKRRKDRHEFILIQLTCPFWDRGKTKLPEGTLCAINIDQIIFIIPGNKNHDNNNHGDDCHVKHDDECHENKHDDDCHVKHDDECHKNKHDDCYCDIWEDDCEDKHVINIKLPSR